jgi:hypothetical protein
MGLQGASARGAAQGTGRNTPRMTSVMKGVLDSDICTQYLDG